MLVEQRISTPVDAMLADFLIQDQSQTKHITNSNEFKMKLSYGKDR